MPTRSPHRAGRAGRTDRAGHPPPGLADIAGDDTGGLSRRGFLKVGFGFSAALACASLLPALSGCSSGAATPQQGLAFLQPDDVAIFRALLPAIVDELASLDANARETRLRDAIRNIDRSCMAMGGHARGELRKLLGLLASTPLRWTLAGVRERWDEASPEQVRGFLARWRASRFATLNAGGVVLVKLASVAYYLVPSTWTASGYPGPNPAIYRALHA